MVGLPKAIIKKYGVTKKAWAVYRGRSKSLRSYAKKAMKKKRRSDVKMARKKRGHSRGGSLLGTVEKLSKVAVVAAPSVRAALMPNDKLGHFVLFNTGYNIRENRMDWTALASSYTPILAAYVGWKAFHKLNGIIRKV